MTAPGASAPVWRAALAGAVAFALGIVVTAGVSFAIHSSIDAEANARFDGAVRRLENELARRITQAAYGMRGLAAAYAAHGEMTTAQFRDWVAARDLQAEFPGVRAFGLIRRVDRAGLDDFVANRREADAAFSVTTAGDRADLFIVSEVEPRAANATVWGYDLGQEETRRAGLERAIATASLALTDRVALLQDPGHRAGWLMFLPVYRKGEDPLSAAGRKRALLGLLYAPIVAADAMGNVRQDFGSQLDFRLYDGPAADGFQVFDSVNDPKEGMFTGVRGGWDGRALRTSRTVSIGGQDLTLDIASAGELEADARSRVPVTLAILGTLLSALLAFAVWLLADGRRRAEALAASMTVHLRRSESQLRSSEAFLEQAQRIANVGGWEVDLETLALRLSSQLLRLFDLPPEATPTIDEFIGFFTPESQEAIEQATREAVRDGTPWDLELSLVSASGVSRWVRTVGHVDREEDRSLRLIGTLQDITERKHAEQALAASETAARQASAAKGQFLANTSHELRTPMNAIIGMLTLLRESRLDERQADHVAKADGAARSLLGLLNDILDFSKVESGKLVLDPRPFRLETLLRDVSVILSANARSDAVQIRFDVDAAVPPVLAADDMRLRQVLINLGGNAVKFTERGEVVVGVRQLGREGGDVRLEFSVTDTGIGIAPDQRARIFEGFTQAEASTARKYGGTGLGLAISQRLVSLMGSRLELQSEPGRGSRFYFLLDLPVGESADLAPAAAQRPRAEQLAGVRILVAEDNRNNQQVARELLASRGAMVEVADDGRKALDWVTAQPDAFDIVLMDVQMPVMDGYTATREIRRAGLAHLPIVAMTANAMAGDRDACIAAGMDDHVGKPFDIDELTAIVQRHVRREEHGAAAPARDAEPVAAEVDLQAAVRRFGGNVEFYRQIYDAVRLDAVKMLDRLGEIAGEGPSEEAQRIFHTLKGLAGTIGATGFAHAAAAGEAAMRDGEDGGVHVATTRAAYANSCERLDSELARLG